MGALCLEFSEKIVVLGCEQGWITTHTLQNPLGPGRHRFL